jgi:hypothetical protein
MSTSLTRSADVGEAFAMLNPPVDPAKATGRAVQPSVPPVQIVGEQFAALNPPVDADRATGRIPGQAIAIQRTVQP